MFSIHCKNVQCFKLFLHDGLSVYCQMSLVCREVEKYHQYNWKHIKQLKVRAWSNSVLTWNSWMYSLCFLAPMIRPLKWVISQLSDILINRLVYSVRTLYSGEGSAVCTPILLSVGGKLSLCLHVSYRPCFYLRTVFYQCSSYYLCYIRTGSFIFIMLTTSIFSAIIGLITDNKMTDNLVLTKQIINHIFRFYSHR